jgi:hypothetical protein
MTAHINIVNLTPHVLNVIKEDGSVVSVMPSGRSLRVNSEYHLSSNTGGIPVYQVQYGFLELIDNATKELVPFYNVEWTGTNTYYIVSGLCLDAIGKNHQTNVQTLPNVMFLAPGELVRDAEGKPIGCKGLRQ